MSWRLTISGYAEGGRVVQACYTHSNLYPRRTSITSGTPRKVVITLFLLVQATKGSAALVLQRYERSCHPNGREAWLEVERIYSGREADERSMQRLALEERSRNNRGVIQQKNS